MGKWKPRKIRYISGNGTFLYFRKLIIFQEKAFPAQKMKKPILKVFLIFREMELSSTKLKKLLIFQGGTYTT